MCSLTGSTEKCTCRCSNSFKNWGFQTGWVTGPISQSWYVAGGWDLNVASGPLKLCHQGNEALALAMGEEGVTDRSCLNTASSLAQHRVPNCQVRWHLRDQQMLSHTWCSCLIWGTMRLWPCFSVVLRALGACWVLRSSCSRVGDLKGEWRIVVA